jgi:streptogramin lyase
MPHLTLSRRHLLATLAAATCLPLPAQAASLQSWPLATSRRTGIHDVAPASDGGVWFTAQASGHLGWFDPSNGRTELISLGTGSAPHGVIQGPDKAAWITDSGQNAIVRVSWPQRVVTVLPMPAGTPWANLNTCAFDGAGDLWFTGQNGYIGRVAARSWQVTVQEAPPGRRGVVVLTGRVLHRARRPQYRQFHHRAPTHATPGRTARVERQPRPHLGERVEQRPAFGARPGEGQLAILAGAG